MDRNYALLTSQWMQEIARMGVQFGNDPETSARVVAACRALATKPMVTKLSPNQTDIALSAKLCLEAGSDAFAVTTTISGMAIDA